MREFIPPATCFAGLPPRFAMRRGGALSGARIAYETFGRLNAARDNAVLILPGLSPDAHVTSRPENPAPGWWEAMVGPGRAVDTDLWHVICLNPLGSCKGSTGPASVDPATGEPYRLRFPELSMEDIADAAACTVEALGLGRLACVIGTSLGAMGALSLLARHPGLARGHINISGAVHALPFSLAIRSLQREAIRGDPHWNRGRYDAENYPERGMRTARKLGLTTYRSAREWDVRFGRARWTGPAAAPAAVSAAGSGPGPVPGPAAAAPVPAPASAEAPAPAAAPAQPPYEYADPFGPEFAVEGYLERHAQHFARRFDPNSYLYLSRCIDRFDLGESCGGSAEEALARIRLGKALVIGVETDILFPLPQQRQIARGLAAGGTDVVFAPLDSPQGHDAFLIDTDRFAPPVAKFLAALR